MWEINPKTAADRGIRNGEQVGEVTDGRAHQNQAAQVTGARGPDTVFCRSTLGPPGRADLLAHYPRWRRPVVRGEAVNTATTYGYDIVTMMQETKTTICNVERHDGTAPGSRNTWHE